MGSNYQRSLYREYESLTKKYESVKYELDVLKYKYRLQEQVIARLKAKEVAQASKEKEHEA